MGRIISTYTLETLLILMKRQRMVDVLACQIFEDIKIEIHRCLYMRAFKVDLPIAACTKRVLDLRIR